MSCKDKEKLRKYNQQYYQYHKKEAMEYSREYYQDHKKERSEYSKKYRQSHKKERKEWNRQYQQSHKKEIKEHALKYRQSHKKEAKERCQKIKLQWIEFFKRKYGEKPKCQVCDKELQWEGNRNEVVYFDHRNDGKVFIKKAPSHWWKANKCTLDNQKIWNECDFGILCYKCNRYLPTKNRNQWLRNITEYILNKEE